MAKKDLVINVIMTASDKASKGFEKLRRSSQTLSAELSRQTDALRKTEKAQKALERFSPAIEEYKRLGEAVLKNRQAQKALAAEIEKTGAPTRKQAAEMERMAAEGRKLSAMHDKQRAELSKLGNTMKAAGVSTRNLKQAQETLAQRHKDATTAVERQRMALDKLAHAQKSIDRARDRSATLRNAGFGAMAQAYSIGRPLQHAAVGAMSEEDAMLGVVRQVSGLKNADGSLNKKAIAEMRAEIQGLSREVPMSTLELMKMYELGAKMGRTREELREFVLEAVKASNAFQSDDYEKLTENLGRIRENFKLSKQEAVELTNVINYLDDNALVSGDQLIDYMNRVSGSMGLAKMSEKHVAALGSALISAGVESETAARAVGTLMTRLGTAPDMKPVREGLAAIGLDAKAVQKGIVEDAQGTLEKIVAAVKKLPKEQQAGVLKDLAGGEFNRVFAQLISNTELWGEQIKLATSKDALGSLDAEFSIRVEAMSSKWQMFKNRLFNTETGVGRHLFDSIEWGMNLVGGLLDKFDQWVAKHPQAAAALAKTAVAATVLLAVLGTLAVAMSTFLLPMAMMRFGFGGVGAAVMRFIPLLSSAAGFVGRLGAALLSFGAKAAVFLVTNPFGWAILAVAALAALYIYWDEVKAALIRGWQWIDQTFADNPVLNFIFPIVGAARLLVNNWSSLTASLSAGWEWIKNAFRENPILYVLTGPVGMIALLIQNWERLKATLTAGWEWFKQLFRDNPIVAALAGPVGMVASLIANFDRLIAKARQLKEAFSGLNITEKINAPFRSIGRVFDGKGFSVGGYTGAGGVNEAAGIVHRGEVVFSQRDVAKFGGWRAVEAIRRGGAGLLARLAEKVSMPSGSSAPRNAGVQAVQRGGFAAAGASFGGDTITIHVHAAPGMSEAGIVEQIRRILDERDADKRRRANSSYRDRD